MKTALLALAFLPLVAAVVAGAQTPTVDFPAGTDWTTVNRPPGSIIAASMHSDYDEFAVPLAATNGGKFLKTQPAKGAVDYLAYSGPASVSTLQNHDRITAQLISEGYKPIFSCTRQQCNGYDFDMALVTPLLDTLNGTGYHNFVVDTFGAVTNDVRYTAFQRGEEYFCLMTALDPGKFSGVLLIDVGGKNPMPQKTTADAAPPASANTSGSGSDATSTARSRLRGRLGALIKSQQ